MYKVVYNATYGGFDLSQKALEFLTKRKGIELNIKKNPGCYNIDILEQLYTSRHDPDLVECVETLGKKANGYCADLKIKTINSDRYFIDDYDGNETIITPEMVDQRWIQI